MYPLIQIEKFKLVSNSTKKNLENVETNEINLNFICLENSCQTTCIGYSIKVSNFAGTWPKRDQNGRVKSSPRLFVRFFGVNTTNSSESVERWVGSAV